MATIIANHKVKNYVTWKRVYDAGSWRREAAGLKEIKVSGTSDDPNHVYMIWETNDLEKFKKMMEDPDLKAKEEEGVVISHTVTTI